MLTPRPDRRLAGIGMRLLAVFFLAIMYALAKLATAMGASLWELLWARQAFALPVIAAIVAIGPGFAAMRTDRPKAHAARSVLGMTGVMLNFATVALLPLAEATTLSFAVPLFGTILAALVLGERVGVHRWGAVVAGFIGVIIVMQPGSGQLPLFGTLVGVAAALSVAGTSLMIRDLGRTESALKTVFWFTLIATVAMSVLMLFVAQAHDAATWAMMVAVGVSGLLAQLAITESLRLAPVSVVLPMDYSALLWASLFGFVLFGALPVSTTWFGAPIIALSGLYIVWREHRRQRTTTVLVVE